MSCSEELFNWFDHTHIKAKADSALTFKNQLCKTASQKLEVLPRVMHYVDVE